MIQIPPNANVVVMHEPINFRTGIDGTAAIARLVLDKEPMGGAFFVFKNRRGHMLRVRVCLAAKNLALFGWSVDVTERDERRAYRGVGEGERGAACGTGEGVESPGGVEARV